MAQSRWLSVGVIVGWGLIGLTTLQASHGHGGGGGGGGGHSGGGHMGGGGGHTGGFSGGHVGGGHMGGFSGGHSGGFSGHTVHQGGSFNQGGSFHQSGAIHQGSNFGSQSIHSGAVHHGGLNGGFQSGTIHHNGGQGITGNHQVIQGGQHHLGTTHTQQHTGQFFQNHGTHTGQTLNGNSHVLHHGANSATNHTANQHHLANQNSHFLQQHGNHGLSNSAAGSSHHVGHQPGSTTPVSHANSFLAHHNNHAHQTQTVANSAANRHHMGVGLNGGVNGARGNAIIGSAVTGTNHHHHHHHNSGWGWGGFGLGYGGFSSWNYFGSPWGYGLGYNRYGYGYGGLGYGGYGGFGGGHGGRRWGCYSYQPVCVCQPYSYGYASASPGLIGYSGVGLGLGVSSTSVGYSPISQAMVLGSVAPVTTDALAPDLGAPAPAVAQANPKPASADDLQSSAEFAAAGETAFKSRDYKGAARSWKHAMVEDPENAVLMLMMGQALFANEQFDEAAGATQLAMQTLPSEQWDVVVKNFRELYGKVDDYTTQLRVLEKAARAKPEEPALRFLLGYHYGFLGYPTEAIKQLDKCVTLAPQDGAAEKLLGLLRAKLPKSSDKPAEGATSVPATTEKPATSTLPALNGDPATLPLPPLPMGEARADVPADALKVVR